MASSFLSSFRHSALIYRLAERDITLRYRGSALGLVWSMVQPLMMLTVYAYVFGIIFQVRWPDRLHSDGEVSFAIILFSGLIIHALFSECFTRAPTLIVQNANYVKKVIFPIEALPITVLVSALFHFIVALVVLIVAHLALGGTIGPTTLLLPIVVAPLLLMTLGISWVLASVGVFLRDIAQLTSVISTVLLFMSPIFFPVEKMPDGVRGLIYLNPLSLIVDEVRNVLLFSSTPNWLNLGAYSVVALIVAQLGFFWFQRTRRGFGDVL